MGKQTMDLEPIRNKPERFIIGLMSGSSCDGVDAALVRCRGTGPGLHMKLVDFKTFPFPDGFRTRLLALRKDVRELCTLNFDLGQRLAEAAQAMIDSARSQGIEVDCIASHGHTVAHVPPRPESEERGTLQLGEAAVIAERTGLPVVSDFRTRDIAAGGQGAPLVAYVDWLLFHREGRVAACLNIGGIANMTVVTPQIEDVMAFDTGPGNMAIDGAMRLLTRGKLSMDEGGGFAAQGKVVEEFLDYLLAHSYFDRMPPKTAGREDFGAEVYLRDALAARRGKHSVEDLLATVTMAVARSIIRAHDRFVAPVHKLARLIVSGGGAHNKTLIRLLKEGFPDVVVRLSDEYGLPADAREAVAFAILGNETLCGTPANVPSATGASRAVVLGKITPGSAG